MRVCKALAGASETVAISITNTVPINVLRQSPLLQFETFQSLECSSFADLSAPFSK